MLITDQGQNDRHPTQISGDEAEDISPLPHKVYIRGLDDLTTSDVTHFSLEHHPEDAPTRVEWIDDTSANIVFESPAIAMRALGSFTRVDDDHVPADNMQLRPARNLSTHPALSLQVRTSIFTDRKRPRAYEASRFYMMHPEHDPRESRRRDASHTNSSYRLRRYGDNEHRRRKQRDQEDGFDASMYDDDESSSKRGSIDASPERHNGSRSSNPQHRVDSYRPARRARNVESRDRSASPTRHQHTPPPSYRARDPHPFPEENRGKELFPTKSAIDSETNEVGKDLFSYRMLAQGLKKELFPHKAIAISHRRSDAFDAADETADLFASGLPVPFTDGDMSGKILSDRISARPDLFKNHLNVMAKESFGATVDHGINIRGASGQQEQGFSIRGAGTIKELFPGRQLGNAGKELFSEKLAGRGLRRNKAEDLFY